MIRALDVKFERGVQAVGTWTYIETIQNKKRGKRKSLANILQIKQQKNKTTKNRFITESSC